MNDEREQVIRDVAEGMGIAEEEVRPRFLAAVRTIHPSLCLYSDTGQEIVRITPDGKVIINPEFTMDEAARRFWEAIRELAAREAGDGREATV